MPSCCKSISHKTSKFLSSSFIHISGLKRTQIFGSLVPRDQSHQFQQKRLISKAKPLKHLIPINDKDLTPHETEIYDNTVAPKGTGNSQRLQHKRSWESSPKPKSQKHQPEHDWRKDNMISCLTLSQGNQRPAKLQVQCIHPTPTDGNSNP